MDFEFLLMQKVKNGDMEAAEQFVRKFYPVIYQYCLLHVHDCNDAEDIAQDTFVRFFESIQMYQNCGKTKNYLYTIAGNIVKNYYKKKKELLLPELPEVAENHMDVIDIRMDIERAVDHLPEDLREVAILFFFQELKQKEIAELLNIKLSLVKYRIGKAKKILSDCLEAKE